MGVNSLVYSIDVPPLLWVLFVILLILSAFFSATETAFTSMSTVRMAGYAENRKKGAARALKVNANYENTLATILIGNNIVNIGMATIGTYICAKIFIDNDTLSGIVSTLSVTLIVLTFGEILPKSFAKRYAEGVAMKTSFIISFLNIVFFPLDFIFNGLGKLVTRSQKEEFTPTVTEDELEVIVENMADEEVLEENDADLIKNAINLSNKIVQDIMIPRIDITAIDIEDSIDHILKKLMKYQYSRIPVFRDDKDKIVGILYERDFYTLLLEGKKFTLKEIIKPVKYVNPNMPVDDFIRELQKEQVHIAIVSGEFGETLGLVTMEDALEELVGEIYDEHDEVEKNAIEELQEGKYSINAKIDMDDLFEELKLGKAPDEHARLSGWLYEKLDDVPKVGNKIVYDDDFMTKNDEDDYVEEKKKLVFTIKEVRGRRITKVLLEIEDRIEEE